MSSVVELRCRARSFEDVYELGGKLAHDSDGCSPEDVRAELRRVVASPRFETSERNRRFLEYVVDETLAGRAGRIKAYNVATTVFGRDETFDPQLDPVVRMEARRLRSSLERFYLTDGKHGGVKIELPKGAYVPLFRNAVILNSPLEHVGRQKASGELARDELGSSILVTGFESEGEQPTPLNLNTCLARHLIIGLSRFPEFFVFGPEAVLPRAPATKHKPLPTPPDAEFMLTGSTAVLGDLLQVNAMLVQPQTGRVLWAQAFHRNFRTGGLLSASDDVANCIVRILAEPFGVVFSNKAQACGKDSRALTPLESVIRFYQYRRGSHQDLFAVREGLERSVIANPDYAETVSCLSLLYTDAHRFGFAHGHSVLTLRRQAVALAHKAIGLAPNASRGYHALGLAYWFMRDVDASLKALQRALSLNPNATEIMADLGLHWALLGKWEKGVPLLEEAFARDPGLPGANRIGLSLYHFAGGRFSQALAEAAQIRAPHLPHGFVAEAISLVRLGRKDEAAVAAKRIEDVAPSCSRGGVLAALAGRNINPDLAGLVSDALDDAILSDGSLRA